jgi:vesicle-fusing ATPase
MELVDAFNTSVYVPNITTISSIDNALQQLGTFDDASRRQLSQSLTNAGLSGRISVGIKKLVYMSEMASQDEEKVEKLFQALSEEGVTASGQ